MKKVYSYENVTMVHSMKNLLAQQGIDGEIRNEHYASGGHVGLGSIPVELWVQDEDAEKACSLIENESSNSNTEAVWICGNCKEENADSFASCWNCQSDKPAS